MYINQKFLDHMLTNKMHFEGTTDTTFIVKEPIGVLVVTKGRMVLADPYAINYGIAISEDIPNGKYPVHIISAHVQPEDEIKVAGVLIQFDEEQVPDEWQMCLPPYVEASEIPEDGFYGITTESYNVAICAEQTVAWLLEHVEESAEVLADIEKQIGATYFANGGVANTILPNIEVNLITVVAGTEKGTYPAYWGYKNGKPVCFAMDFLVVD